MTDIELRLRCVELAKGAGGELIAEAQAIYDFVTGGDGVSAARESASAASASAQAARGDPAARILEAKASAAEIDRDLREARLDERIRALVDAAIDARGDKIADELERFHAEIRALIAAHPPAPSVLRRKPPVRRE